MLAEIEALVAQGVLEVTLLGQNVNSYGREFGDRYAFGALLRAAGAVDGLERVRFTSPHPRDFTDDVIAAMAETPAVCHSLHMPLQSGSDAVLRAMRRSYRRDRYLGILARVRDAMPDAAITTDIIVGFPGETEADFEQTLDLVRRGAVRRRVHLPVLAPARTPAAAMDGQVPRDVVQERYERLIAVQDEASLLGEPGTGRLDGRGAGGRGRGAQGRRDRPAVGTGPGRPPRALRLRRGRGPARGRGDHRGDVRRAAPPGRRRAAARRTGGPRPGTRTRPGGGRARAPGVLLGMPTVRGWKFCRRAAATVPA